jgi:hypothetical protein
VLICATANTNTVLAYTPSASSTWLSLPSLPSYRPYCLASAIHIDDHGPYQKTDHEVMIMVAFSHCNFAQSWRGDSGADAQLLSITGPSSTSPSTSTSNDSKLQQYHQLLAWKPEKIPIGLPVGHDPRACVTVDGLIYFANGVPGGHHLYDGHNFVSLPDPTYIRHSTSMCAGEGSRRCYYLLGGRIVGNHHERRSDSTPQGIVERYDIFAERWTTLPNFDGCGCAPATFMFNGCLWVGGTDASYHQRSIRSVPYAVCLSFAHTTKGGDSLPQIPLQYFNAEDRTWSRAPFELPSQLYKVCARPALLPQST